MDYLDNGIDVKAVSVKGHSGMVWIGFKICHLSGAVAFFSIAAMGFGHIHMLCAKMCSYVCFSSDGKGCNDEYLAYAIWM